MSKSKLEEEVVNYSTAWTRKHSHIINARRRKQHRTLEGCIKRMYNGIKYRPKWCRGYQGRGRECSISFDRFRDLCLKKFKVQALFDQWESSGFIRKLALSVDRVDNSRGYSEDNIQVITVSENSSKTHRVDIPKPGVADITKERRCYVCREVLPLEAFNKDKARLFGRGHECRTCSRRRGHKKYYALKAILTKEYLEQLCGKEGKS